jgi:hypothetical protein
MPIPPFNEDGLLPVGLHDCTFRDLDDRFGRDQWVGNRLSSQRSKLFSLFQDYLSKLRKELEVAEVIIDGSFVTAKPDPNDIDLIVVMAEKHDFGQELRPFEYNLLSARRVQQSHKFDLRVVPFGGQAYHEAVEFFSRVKDYPRVLKVLLRIVP